LPAYRSFEFIQDKRKPATKNFEILKDNNDLISYTPAGQYDDSFILEFAMNFKGLILSNDKFEDKQFVENIQLHEYYSNKYKNKLFIYKYITTNLLVLFSKFNQFYIL